MSPESIHAGAEINRLLGDAEKVQLYREMVRARCFEQACLKGYTWGRMSGFLYLQIGQEGIPVAFRSLMGPDDHHLSGHRCLGHALASGMSMNACMAELHGKVTGCSKGKGGAYGMFAPERRYWGGYSLAGAQTPVAAGLGFALKLRETRGVVCCFLGDGAVNQGCFHESLNLAGLFNLPVVYVIENNEYSMGTSVRRSSAFKDCLARRAEGYDIDWDLINGDDIYEIRAKAHVAFERARLEQRPTVLEVSTYRYYGLSVADANHKRYRTPEEIEERKDNHDPVKRWREQLIRERVLDDEAADAIREEAKEEARLASEFAVMSRAPGIGEITEDVYWESDRKTEASRVGRHQFDDGGRDG